MTEFQVEVARTFFGLEASADFLLAGGAALAAQRLTNRPTQDLDFFTRPDTGNISQARDAFEAVARERGCPIRRVRNSQSFCRMIVSGPEELIIDLAIDSPPGLSPAVSMAGPTFAEEELAGRKVIALFDRAEARDFVDVHVLADRFFKDTLLRYAATVDLGFDHKVYAEMIGALQRFADSDLPIAPEHAGALRQFFARWSVELSEQK